MMPAASNVGRWDFAYRGVTEADARYGDTESYQLGADWLANCATVEDWGCGLAWFARHLQSDQTYVGIDGSASPFRTVGIDIDLATYRSAVPGIFMRHVLEHNYAWRDVLDNALASFTERMCLVLFTPWHDGPGDELELQHEPGYDVPTLALRRGAIEERIGAHPSWSRVELQSPGTAFGVEHVYLIAAAS